jgi:hypothetical protein
LCGRLDLNSGKTIELLDALGKQIDARLSTQTVLQKTHLVFPHVGWRLRVSLERTGEGPSDLNLWGETELDLERNHRLTFDFGTRDAGPVVASDEEEQLSTDKPDDLRSATGLKVRVDYVMPSGEVGRVELERPASEPGERKIARSVELSRPFSGPPGEPLAALERVELPEADLVGEPPRVEKSEPVGLTAAPAGATKPRAQLKRSGK